MDPLDPLRTRLRDTFAGQGEGVPAWENALEEGDDAGHFPPDSAVWSVHGGMTPIAAGIRALLVQALHPGALAGVVEHSDYRADPLGRLAGTIRWIFTVTYGDTAAARRACDYVRGLHASVTGRYVDGRGVEAAYSANDPELAEWVHIAFMDAFLRSYELFRGPVPQGADAYVREWAVAGEMMGVADPPRSEAALRARMQQYDDEGKLAGGPRVAEVVRFIAEPPLDPWLMPGYRMLFAAVVDTLPPRYRELLGLAPPRFGRLARVGARTTLAVAGAALGSMGPSERAARRRLARLGVAGAAMAAGDLLPNDLAHGLTYDEHGLTRERRSPGGFRTASHRIRVGTGPEAFESLATGILQWDLHRAAGLRVAASTPRAAPGVDVVPGFGAGPWRLAAPCRVVWAEDVPDDVVGVDRPVRAGFGYGTLRGHPESGEESFVAVLEPDGGVYFELFAFSRHANWFYRLGGPVATACQRLVTRRYLRAATALGGEPRPATG